MKSEAARRGEKEKCPFLDKIRPVAGIEINRKRGTCHISTADTLSSRIWQQHASQTRKMISQGTYSPVGIHDLYFRAVGKRKSMDNNFQLEEEEDQFVNTMNSKCRGVAGGRNIL